MPTTRPRHAITETPEISAALKAAAQRWPADRGRPAALLRRLIEAGAESVAAQSECGAERRRAAIAKASGALTGVYGPGYLEELRDEWPA